MKLFIINIRYEVRVDEEIPIITTLKYNRETKEFEQAGAEGQYIKNDLICLVAEQQVDIIEVIETQIGRTADNTEIEIIDTVDLDNIIQPEQTIIDDDGNEHIIPAVKGKVVFQGGYDISKEELKDLLDDAIDLLMEMEAL